MIRSFCLVLACVIALVAAGAKPAPAQVAIDAGGFGINGTADFGMTFSGQIFKTPVLPLAVEITGAKPFGERGWAATADARFTLGKTTLGGGIGVGDIANTAFYGGIYQAILAQNLVPHVSLEGRLYMGPGRPSSFFGGLRFSL